MPAYLGDLNVLAPASVAMPLRGNWSAVVALDGEHDVSGTVELKLGDQLFRGATKRSTPSQGRTTVQLVGGAGALRSARVRPQQYRSATVRQIIEQLLGPIGEALSGAAGHESMDRRIDWVRTADTAARQLDLLSAHLGLGWRVLDTGEVWVGAESWPDDPSAVVLETRIDDRQVICDGTDPSIRPGTTVGGHRIADVTHHWGSSRSVAEMYVQGRATGRQADRTAEIVMRRLPDARWSQLHPGRVVSQADDLTVQVIVESDWVPGLVGVPLGMPPGVRFMVKAGTRVKVGFEAGDPTRPYAIFDYDSGGHQDALTSVEIDGDLIVSGSITVTGGDVVADGISLKTHTHPTPVGPTGIPTPSA